MGDLLLKVLSARKEGSTLLDPSGWPVANSSLNLQPSLLTAISPAHGGPLPNPLHWLRLYALRTLNCHTFDQQANCGQQVPPLTSNSSLTVQYKVNGDLHEKF